MKRASSPGFKPIQIEKMIFDAFSPAPGEHGLLDGSRGYLANFASGEFECYGTIKINVRRLAENIYLGLCQSIRDSK